MNLGNSLFHARKKCGLSQEEAAQRLGVSRQTVSKWETDETLPDIRQSKKMAVMYNLSLDELIDFDINADNYAVRLGVMIDELKAEYGYSELDAFLVLKDILAKVWKKRKK